MVVLDNLKEDELLSIFLGSPESGLRQSTAYFASQGIKLELSDAAARRIARDAARQPRLRARPLKEVFRRVIRDHRLEPRTHSKAGVPRVDLPHVQTAL